MKWFEIAPFFSKSWSGVQLDSLTSCPTWGSSRCPTGRLDEASNLTARQGVQLDLWPGVKKMSNRKIPITSFFLKKIELWNGFEIFLTPGQRSSWTAWRAVKLDGSSSRPVGRLDEPSSWTARQAVQLDAWHAHTKICLYFGLFHNSQMK